MAALLEADFLHSPVCDLVRITVGDSTHLDNLASDDFTKGVVAIDQTQRVQGVCISLVQLVDFLRSQLATYKQAVNWHRPVPNDATKNLWSAYSTGAAFVAEK